MTSAACTSWTCTPGPGALGLEALSRGAASVLLVESDARAAAVVKANVKALGLPGATVAADRVERLLARPPGDRGDQPATTATTWCSPTRRTR